MAMRKTAKKKTVKPKPKPPVDPEAAKSDKPRGNAVHATEKNRAEKGGPA